MLGRSVWLFALAMASFTPAPVALTAEHSGSTVRLHVGQSVTVSLHGSGGTGFRWEVEPGAESILEQQGDPGYRSDVPDRRLLGGGGTYTYTFRATKKGSAELKLIYHRPWEKEVAPVRTFQVQVVVDD